MNNITKKATSIAEAMVVMLIITIGVVGMYKVYTNSQKLSNTTANKIQAIQIAREGIEAMKNIRDTNWILYGADSDNCWNVHDYNSDCVGDTTDSNDIIPSKYNGGTYIYKVYKGGDNRWVLEMIDTSLTPGDFTVRLDSNGFYTQSGGLKDPTKPLKPLFTRKIQIEYLKANDAPGDSNDPKMQVTSLVQWADSSSTQIHKVEFTTILTNWKK